MSWLKREEKQERKARSEWHLGNFGDSGKGYGSPHPAAAGKAEIIDKEFKFLKKVRPKRSAAAAQKAWRDFA